MAWISPPEFLRIKAMAKARKARRGEKAAENAVLRPARLTRTALGASKRPKRVKTARKRLIAILDHLFSLAVRRRDSSLTGGNCVLGCGRIECVAHLITRSKHSVRWDLRNGTGQCHGANYRHEFDPHPYTGWYIRKHGLDAYEALVRDGNRVAKFSNAELEAKRDELKRLLEA